MWLHKVELRHVRQLKELSLSFAPLTLIGGPQGAGKTTLQKAILAAMFQVKKEEREQLRSRFDPDSPPLAILELSRSKFDPPLVLTRRLTDDTGEWKEGATTLKGRGAALEQIQKSLPISADAAALLLWGLQDSMTAVIDSFPSDGHSLLTAATIRGSGPDPKKVVEELEKDFKNAKKGGKDPGSLTRAEEQVESLGDELERANQAQQKVAALKRAYEQAKIARDQAQQLREDTKKAIERLSNLERLLDAALKAKDDLSNLEKKQEEWDDLESDIRDSQKQLQDLELELAVLQSQFRVAKDKEVRDEAERLALQIAAVEEADNKRAGIQAQLNEKKRPDKRDQDEYDRLKADYREADASLRATGVRYRLLAESGSSTVHVREDQEPSKQVQVTPGVPHEGVVGNVEIVLDNLRVVASGKVDVAGLKHSREEARKKGLALLRTFGVSTQEEFRRLRGDRERLDKELQKAEREVEKELKGTTLASLRAALKCSEKARMENGVTQQDFDVSRGKHIPPSAEIDKKLGRKDGEIDSAKKELQKLQRKRPSDTERSQHELDLRAAREKAAEAAAKFKQADEAQGEPTTQLLAEFKEVLRKERTTLNDLLDPQKNPENEVARLATELRYAGPERPIASIEADLEDAKATLRREEVLQAGRELLKERIQSKIAEMTADVPRELGHRISQHLASLTRGAYGKLMLTDDLSVTTVEEGGATAEHWEPRQLSHGERHVTALAIKIAVARSLAELTGPVFVILDDSLVTFDPEHRQSTEDLLMDLVADSKLQVILLTCHTDWAADWKKRAGDRVQYVELAKIANYYRPPVGVALSNQEG